MAEMKRGRASGTSVLDRIESRTTESPPRLNADILRAAEVLFEPGGIVELRAIKNGAIAAGYFDDNGALVREAVKLDGQGFTVYVTANPVNPALLSRAVNRIKRPLRETTSDKDVLRRRWLLVDFDPVRPAGVSSTATEKEAALGRAREVYGYLKERGWPEPVAGDSGNGAHLLYAVDLPNDAESLALVRGVLEALSFKFSDGAVSVDTTTSNAARIWKLYGTTARKGDSTEDRPHRASRLLKVPCERMEVSWEQLDGLAASTPDTPTPERKDRKITQGVQFDLDTWIRNQGIEVKREGLWQQGGYRWVLEKCPWNGHTDNAAYIVRLPNGAIAAGCQHDSCQGFGWRDLREHFEPGYRERKSERFGETRDSESDRVYPAPETSWPEIGDEAFYGLAGEIVRSMEPHSEADPVALLASLLCAFGNVCDRRTHYQVSADRHAMNLFAAFVGESSKARKGMSWNFVESLMRDVDERWMSSRVVSGISSGEGLIHHVRDRREKQNEDGETEVIDEGVADKRLLSIEGELASLLKVMARQGSTTSAVIRNAWDGKKLQNLTKNSPDAATNAHISIIGHITKGELLRHLTETEAANGFANRFLWFMVRRSKQLPFGGQWKPESREPFVDRLEGALRFARQGREITWSEGGAKVWEGVYGPLTEGKSGMFGAVVARGEAQTVRLATIYAVLDHSEEIRREHILAALALWEYAEESARYIFGDASGDPEADTILEALRANKSSGLTRTNIRDLFGRNKNAERIGQALALLSKLGKAYQEYEETGGRPVERWFAR